MKWHFDIETKRWWTEEGLDFDIEQYPDGTYEVSFKDPTSGRRCSFALTRTLRGAKKQAEIRQAFADGKERRYIRQAFKKRR